MNDLKETIKDKVTRQQEREILPVKDLTGKEAEDDCNSAMQLQEISMVPNMAVDMQGAKDRILELQDFIRYMMVPNIDYGFVPGCPKPMLFKSGAEKLCDIYGLTKHIEVTKRMEDWEKGIFHYEVKATLISKKTGHIESEGVGCCNSREKKFSNQDPYSIVNNVLKMAKKRAIVDATLAATRTSGIFSQDMENHTV